MLKAMQAEGVEWARIIGPVSATRSPSCSHVDQLIDEHLERMAQLGQADRNGCYHRWPLTEVGAIDLAVPRTRTFSALKVVRPTPGGRGTSTA